MPTPAVFPQNHANFDRGGAKNGASRAERRAYYWSDRRSFRVNRAAAKVIRGALIAGWWVQKQSVSVNGSVYVKFRRRDRVKITMRVSDHSNKSWRNGPRGYDCRTDPNSLLQAIRYLRHFPTPGPEPDPMTPAEEIATANALTTELRRRQYLNDTRRV